MTLPSILYKEAVHDLVYNMKALDYHEATKHSWAGIHADSHYLDFDNMPRPFKIYSDVTRRSLRALHQLLRLRPWRQPRSMAALPPPHNPNAKV